MRDPFWTPSRAISLLLVIVYVGLSYTYRDAECALLVLGCCLLPLLCIWCPEALSRWIGYGSGWIFRTGFTSDTPPIMISIGGWLLLATLPIAASIWITSR